MSFPRYPAYKDSGVEWLGEVPAHWETWKVAHAFGSIGSGTTPPSSEDHWYDNGTIPWVTTGELRENVISETSKSVTSAALEKFPALRVHPAGSLVVAMYGATIGRLGILGVDATTNQACCVLSDPKHLDIAFTYYWLQGFKRIIIDLFSSGGGQPNINQDIVSGLHVPAPGLPEQKAITTFLDRETAKIDALVVEQENLIGLLKEKRQAVVSHAVTKGLDPSVPMKDSGVEWLGEVPAHWAMQKVKHLTSRISSGKTPLGGSETYVDEGVTFLRSQNVYDDGLRLDDVVFISEDTDQSMAVSRVIPGDILLNITGASIGRSCIVPRGLKTANVNQHVCAIRLTDESLAPFAAWIFKSALVKNQIDFAQNGAAREGLNFEQIGGMVVVMPPTCEQAAIAAFLDRKITSLDALIAEAQSAITLLQERRTALISAAVTGQIDVRGLFFAQTEEGPA